MSLTVVALGLALAAIVLLIRLSGGGRPVAAEDPARPLQPLTPRDREHFIGAWNRCETHFADDPEGAVYEADQIVCDVITVRGSDVSALDKVPATHYEAAHRITELHRRGRARGQDLRQAMPHYRIVFSDLVQTHASREQVHN